MDDVVKATTNDHLKNLNLLKTGKTFIKNLKKSPKQLGLVLDFDTMRNYVSENKEYKSL